MNNYEFGHIVLFVDNVNGIEKVRPLLIYEQLSDCVLIGAKCTTKRRDYDQYSYFLNDWKEVGLKEPSSVRCDKFIHINRSAIVKKKDGTEFLVGKLSLEDCNNISNIFYKYTDELKQIGNKLNDIVNNQTLYAIRETETINEGKTNTRLNIFNDKEAAKIAYSKCQTEISNISINGQITKVTTSYELGTVPFKKGKCIDEGFKLYKESTGPAKLISSGRSR